jgi:hypothetical protein
MNIVGCFKKHLPFFGMFGFHHRRGDLDPNHRLKTAWAELQEKGEHPRLFGQGPKELPSRQNCQELVFKSK